MHWVGTWANVLGSVAQGTGVFFLVGAAIMLGERHNLVLSGRVWIGANLFFLVCLLLYGVFYYGYYWSEAFRDFAAYSLAVCFVRLGASPYFWRRLKKPLLVVLLLALMVNTLASWDLLELFSLYGEEVRLARDSVGYRTQHLLDIWPLFLILSPLLSSMETILVAGVIVFSFLQQIFFQKRIETIFIIGMLLVFWVTQRWFPMLSRLAARKEAHLLRWMFVLALFTAVFGFLLAPAVFKGQTEALVVRFAGKGPGQEQYTMGFWSVFSMENERVQVVSDCFSNFESHEWLIGRGMGGAFPWYGFNQALLESDRAEDVVAAHFLPDVGEFARRGFEASIVTPLLKGGVLFALVFYSVYAIALSRLNLFKSFSAKCFAVSSYWLLYTFIAGNFTLTLSFEMLSMFAPLGWCLSRWGSRAQRQLPSSPATNGSANHAPAFPTMHHSSRLVPSAESNIGGGVK